MEQLRLHRKNTELCVSWQGVLRVLRENGAWIVTDDGAATADEHLRRSEVKRESLQAADSTPVLGTPTARSDLQAGWRGGLQGTGAQNMGVGGRNGLSCALGISCRGQLHTLRSHPMAETVPCAHRRAPLGHPGRSARGGPDAHEGPFLPPTLAIRIPLSADEA